MRALAVAASILGLAACTGEIGPPQAVPEGYRPDDPPAPVCTAEARDPGESTIRRLNSTEYDNTIRDLLGDDSHPAAAWLPDGVGLGFDNNAKAQVVTLLHAQQMMTSAEEVAARAVQDLRALVPCDIRADEAGCAAGFIEDFAGRAYRRPLTEADRQALQAVFEYGRSTESFVTGIRLVIETVLQSPHFLYRVEVEGVAEGEGRVRLSDHELASRLSYSLWGSMPDPELRAAADAGALHTREQLRAQAERMLDDPRARAAVRDFARQWLDLADLDHATRDPALYPGFDAAAVEALREGTLGFVEHVTFDSELGDLHELLTADFGAPAERAGVLTDPGVMAAHAKYDQSSPIQRGVFVREHLLCQELPNPPDDVDIRVPPLDPSLTTRERFAAHTEHPACAGCHDLIDGIGFGFEGYDAVGAFRATENGLPVDATGEIVATDDLDGPFDGAVELAHRFDESDQVRRCFTTQWFRFAFGRGDGEDDACTMEDLDEVFVASGTRVRDLLVALTQTDAFLYRRADATDQEGCAP